MADVDFDLETLIDVEQTFYDNAYEEAFAHGRVHAAIEGRAMGREKGFEIWEELGFYEGFALIWKTVYEKRQDDGNDRIKHHIKHLLDSIAKFPLENPSSEVDLSVLTRQIRSRYKALCSTLGVKPSLRVSQDQASNQTGAGKSTRSLWKLENDTRRTAEENQGLNF